MGKKEHMGSNNITYILIFLLLIIYPGSLSNSYQVLSSDGSKVETMEEPIDKKSTLLSDYFIQNIGQIRSPNLLFYSSMDNLFITKEGIYYKVLDEYSMIDKNESVECGTILRYSFIGSNMLNAEGVEKCNFSANFFIGNDRSEWYSNVPTYNKIIIPNVWNDIDLIYEIRNGNIKYNIVLHPGAYVTDIKIRIEGQKSLVVNENNELLIKTEYNTVRDKDLYVFDEKGDQIKCEYILLDRTTYSFKMKDDRVSMETIIDPYMEYSTYIGPSGTGGTSWYSLPESMTVDKGGNAFLGGCTVKWTRYTAYNYIGPYAVPFCDKVVITKLNPAGNSLLFTTILGGGCTENGGVYSCGTSTCDGIVVDDSNYIYITGSTSSNDFPTTENAFDRVYDGGSEIFVTKLCPNGSAMVYSTFLGSSNCDDSSGIDIDDKGCAYICGSTYTEDYPVTDGSYDTTINGRDDAIVTKLDKFGSSLVYSTFFGGSGYDFATDIKVDSFGNAIIIGGTNSSDLPRSEEARNYSGDEDIFVVKIDDRGVNITFCTYLGGIKKDVAQKLAVDNFNDIYVTGFTYSSDFPTTESALDREFNGYFDIFITKFDSGGRMKFSTFLGGTNYDCANGISVVGSGNVCIAGETGSTNYPTTRDAFNRSNGMIVFSVISSTGSKLLYSTLIGDGRVIGMERDTVGNIYFAGDNCNYHYYPIIEGAYKNSSSIDGNYFSHFFMTKFNFQKTFPNITDLTNINATTGDPFIVSANVTDLYGIEKVILTYKFNDVMEIMVSMDYRLDDLYQKMILIPEYFIDEFLYRITARNTLGNDNSTEYKKVIIHDNDRPIFLKDMTENRTGTGFIFSFIVDVMDNIVVKNVTVEYWYDSEGHSNMSMKMGYYYYCDIEIPMDRIMPIHYRFHATDASDNWNDTDERIIEIDDSLSPVFINDMTPKYIGTGEMVVFSVNITDNIKVLNVSLIYRIGKENMTLINMTGNNVYTYRMIAPINSTEPIYYIFEATDINKNSVNLFGRIIVNDTIVPTAVIHIEPMVNEDERTSIDGSYSYDNIEVKDYIWKIQKDHDELILTGKNINVTFMEPKSYTIMLKVIDDAGNADYETVEIVPRDMTPPIADAGNDIIIDMGTYLIFNGTKSTDNVAITTWIWKFDYADLNTVLEGPNPGFLFSYPGVFEIMLTVFDGALNTDRDNLSIKVRDIIKPIADAGFDQTVMNGTKVFLIGSNSTDNIGIVEWKWVYLYDGSSEIKIGQVVEKTFTYPGNFSVFLTVYDAEGNNDTDVAIINVMDNEIESGEPVGDEGWLEWWMLLSFILILECIIVSWIFLRKRKFHKETKTSDFSTE